MNIKYLLLIAAALTFTQTASAQSAAYKCIVDGKTIYSESACKIEATKQTTRDERRTGKQTTRDERRTGKPTRATKPAGSKKYVCEAAKQDLANLDSMASQLNSSSVQEQVKERKAVVHKILYEWEC